MIFHPAFIRFGKYMTIGGTTFGFDVLVMFILIRSHIAYPVATFTAFLLAVSVNYLISRRYVFKGTTRSLKQGYINMMATAVMGALLTSSLTIVAVQFLELGSLAARLPVAAVIGIGNYLFNLYTNFKVAGHHA